jgi:hypothetical protein
MRITLSNGLARFHGTVAQPYGEDVVASVSVVDVKDTHQITAKINNLPSQIVTGDIKIPKQVIDEGFIKIAFLVIDKKGNNYTYNTDKIDLKTVIMFDNDLSTVYPEALKYLEREIQKSADALIRKIFTLEQLIEALEARVETLETKDDVF